MIPKKCSATVSPGAGTDFSPNVIPWINSSSEWAEDANFSYTSGNLNVGPGVINAARVSIYGNSDVSGNAFRVANLSGSAILTVQNNKMLLHTFDNTNYGSIGTGYAVQFARVSGIALRIGTNATGSLMQAVSTTGTFSKLNLNPFGGEVEIGPSTLASNSFLTVYTSPSSFVLGTYSARIVGGSGSNLRVLNFITSRVGTDNKIAIQATEVGNAAHAIQIQPLGGNTAIGHDVLPTSKVDIGGSSGYNALRIRDNYTPSGPADANGEIGQIASDDDYIYKKTAAGWKRVAITLIP